jgi:hypothetical protein
VPRRLLEGLMQVSAEHEAQLCTGLSDSERRRLIGLLSRVAAEQGLPPAFTRASLPPTPTTSPDPEGPGGKDRPIEQVREGPPVAVSWSTASRQT